MKTYKQELESYDTTTATIHFAVDKPLPTALVTKLVRSRMEKNERRTRRQQGCYSQLRLDAIGY